LSHFWGALQEYDTSLRQRGSLSFWVSQELIENWTIREKTGMRGASRTYTDAAIETLAIVGSAQKVMLGL